MSGVGRCGNCGHVLGSHCMECDREFVCGDSSVPCPKPGCLEGVLPDPRRDSQAVWREVPRQDHPSDPLDRARAAIDRLGSIRF